MRFISNFTDQKLAEKFAAVLAKAGIEAEVRAEDSEFGVWVYQEEQIAESRSLHSEFVKNPDDKRFQVSTFGLKAQLPKSINDRHRVIDVRREVFGAANAKNIVTMTLIVVSVILTIIVEIPAYKWLKAQLMYSNYIRPMFLEISQGQVWRLITPIFLHAGFLHILFNMMWLHTLGGQIEQQKGSRFLLVFILLTAVTVNTAQYLTTPAPFLGMSGVVYALFGYMWMAIRYEAGCRYELSDFTVKLMIFWLFFCLFLPNVANTQHFVGAGLGAAYGYLTSGALKAALRRRRYRNKFK
jgi:GlpG protein